MSKVGEVRCYFLLKFTLNDSVCMGDDCNASNTQYLHYANNELL